MTVDLRRRQLWSVFVVAVVARVAFIAVFALDDPTRIRRTIARDGTEIGRIAANLSEGRGYSSPFEAGTQPTAWVCPAIPALWAAILLAAGEDSPAAMAAVWVSQAVASSLAAVLYVAILGRVLPMPAARSVLPWWGLAVALWPESILRITELWYYTWQELGIAVLVWLGIAWRDDPSRRNAVGLGVAGGLVALVNVTPAPVFLLALARPVVGRVARGVRARAALAVVLAALIVSPWLVRNAAVFDRPIPLRGNAGFELWQGNNPRAAIRQTQDSVHPGIDARELQRYREIGEVAYNRESLAHAIDWIRAHPREVVVNAAARVYVTWFTDLTDRWSWYGTPWWQEPNVGWFVTVRQVVSSVTAVGALAALLLAFAAGAVRHVPYAYLLLGVPLLVPLPHYLTQIDPSYVAFTRVWLVMFAVAALAERWAHAGPGRADGPSLAGPKSAGSRR